MSKNILSLFGFLCLLLIAFVAGYYVHSRSCVVDTVLDQIASAPTVNPGSAVVVTASPTPTVAKAIEVEAVFSNYNSASVGNQPTSPTVFSLATKRTIYSIQDYHWNSARGKTPGTIGLKHEDGRMFGPWEAKGDPGQGGVPNAYWTISPNVEVPAGTYTIVDSDPASWAQNGGTKGIGMSQVYAVKE